MNGIGHLVEQHILEFESRQKHVDELLTHARNTASEAPEHADIRDRLQKLQEEQDRLVVRLDELRLKNLDNWREEEIEKSGLMGIWDALAQQAEKLVERLEQVALESRRSIKRPEIE